MSEIKPIRICYQSFTNRDYAVAYLDCLQEVVCKAADAGTIVDECLLTNPVRNPHRLEEFRAAQQVLVNAEQAEEEQYDAFVIGHFQDTTLSEAKSLLNIPVLGLGENSLLFACGLAKRIGLVAIHSNFLPWHRDQVLDYALQGRIAGISSMDMVPAAFMNLFSCERKAAQFQQCFIDSCLPLIRDGAEIIVPAGGIPMVLCAKFGIKQVKGVPVLDGVSTLIKSAEMSVKLNRLNGTMTSNVGSYASPLAWR